MTFESFLAFLPALLRGAGVTIVLTVTSLLAGMVLGLFIAVFRLGRIRVLRAVCKFYVWFFRGTPLMLQIFFIHYALPVIVPGLLFDPMVSAFVALSLNTAAYLAEIVRAAIESIDKGQMEAAKALGMTSGQAMRRIIIPQSYRRLIPPVGNEIIAQLKDTSLVSAIAISDLMRVSSQQAIAAGGDMFYFVPAMVIYLALTTLLTGVFGRLEKKFSVYE